MNWAQRIILVLGAVFIVASLFNPPTGFFPDPGMYGLDIKYLLSFILGEALATTALFFAFSNIKLPSRWARRPLSTVSTTTDTEK